MKSKYIFGFLLVLVFNCCLRNSESITSDFIDSLIQLDSTNMSNAFERIAISTRISNPSDYDEPCTYIKKSNKKKYVIRALKLSSDSSIFCIALSISPKMAYEKQTEIIIKKLGQPNAMNSKQEPYWKLHFGYICLSKGDIIFQNDNICDHAELLNFPRMPDNNKLNEFIENNNLHEIESVFEPELKLLRKSYYEHNNSSIINRKYSFYYSDTEDNKIVNAIEINLPFNIIGIDFDFIDNKLIQLFPEYDSSIKRKIKKLKLTAIQGERFIEKNMNYVIDIKSNPIQIRITIWRRQAFERKKYLME